MADLNYVQIAEDFTPLRRSDAEMAQVIAESYRTPDGCPSVPAEKFLGVSGAAAKLAESGDPLFEPLKKFLGVTCG